jgi:hypothetical protein
MVDHQSVQRFEMRSAEQRKRQMHTFPIHRARVRTRRLVAAFVLLCTVVTLLTMTTQRRANAYNLWPKWPTTNLTYAFQNGTPDIANDGEQRAVEAALAEWSKVTSLKFTKVASVDTSNLKFKFENIDGPSNKLAVGFGPTNGWVAFDESETWRVPVEWGYNPGSSTTGIDLITVATHEIGHALGLGHSDAVQSIMEAVYPMNGSNTNSEHRWVSADDVAGIQTHYGAPRGAYGWVSTDGYPVNGFTYTDANAYNSSGNVVTVTGISNGYYRVRFAGLGSSAGGNVQVSAEDSAAGQVRCKVDHWGNSPDGTAKDVYVRCFLGATPTGSSFNVQFRSSGQQQPVDSAYLWADQPTAASYTPSANYSFNPTTWTNHITRLGTGWYKVEMPGFYWYGGLTHVTAYGSGSEHCESSWLGGSGSIVNCYTASGAPVDTKFTMAYSQKHVANGGRAGAFVQITSASPALNVVQTYSDTNQWTSHGDKVTVRRGAVGTYYVQVPNMPSTTRGFVTVSSQQTNRSCHTGRRYIQLGASTDVLRTTNILVLCHDNAGARVDSTFALSFGANVYQPNLPAPLTAPTSTTIAAPRMQV